jgi:ABC-type multidrug transport system ATPase subunit
VHALVARLADLRAQGTILVLTTHDLDLVDGLLDRAVVLRGGRLAGVETECRGLRERYRARLASGDRA